VTPSLEARSPLQVAVADGQAGRLPKEQSGISISRKGIQLTAYRPNSPDNPVYSTITNNVKATLIRLWEQGGTSDRVVVKFPNRTLYRKATPVNFRGEIVGDPIAVTNGELAFFLGAYAPASFVLE
jgi:hypothetical protein